MSSRLLTIPQISRVAISFAVVVAFYGAYSLLAVPLIEPVAKERPQDPNPGGTPVETRPSRHALLLKSLYPDATVWQRKRPKMVETDDVVLLFKDYRTLDQGRMEITPCTLLFIQKADKPRSDGHPGRVVVLDIPEGAILQFDEDVDLRRGEFGQLVGGRLAGEVTIRSNESEPGADDHIFLATSNVNMDERRLWTPSEVSFRFGQSYGRGRDLIASFLPAVDGGGGSRGPNIGGLKSLEIVHLERLHLVAGDAGFGKAKESGTSEPHTVDAETSTAEQASPQSSAPDSLAMAFENKEAPIEVTCKGPFLLDLEEGVATFEEQVDVLRLNKDAPSDQLNCRWLELHFDGLALGTRSKKSQSPSVKKVVALGYPVILNSPSLGAHAQGERLEYDIALKQIRLDGEQPVVLDHQGRRIEAAAVQYRMPEVGRIGQAWAEGPGSFRAKLPGADPRQPPRIVTARWKDELQLRPDGGLHVLSLLGEARFGEESFGGLSAGQLHVWLKEANPAVEVAVEAESEFGGILPDRLLAERSVQLDSPVLTGNTERFEVWFHHLPADTFAQNVPHGNAGSLQSQANDARPFGRNLQEPTTKFDVSGDVLRTQLAVAGKQVQLRNVSVEGDATIKETSALAAGESPLHISGEIVHVTGADSPQARAVVAGEPAIVSGRGISLKGRSIHLDRAQNRVTIPGVGEATLPLAGLTQSRSPQNQPLARARYAAHRVSDQQANLAAHRSTESALVTWQDGLQFDGQTIQVRGQVEAKTDQQRLRAPLVEIGLTKRIDLSQAPRDASVNIQDVRLTGQVMMENRTVTGGELTSIDEMMVKDLTIDQQTGAMSADGPGWMKSVRKGSGFGPGEFTGPAFGQTRTPQREPPPANQNALTYLRVTFQTAMTGNIHNRQVQLHEGVRAIYGSVKRWDEAINPDRALETGGNVVLLTSDTLQVAEMGSSTSGDQPTSLGPVELQALGNATVEGSTFTARAHRIAYAQAKDMLVMEGDGRTDAELFRQSTAGGQTGRASARKILYWPSTGRMDVDTFNSLDWAGTPTGPAGQNPLPAGVGDYLRRERESRPQRLSTPPR